MTLMTQHPWASGPGEILRHGLALLKADSDTNRRLAMISIDNAVELMIRTYLGLPNRITGLTISRREYQEISESFTAMLDAIEKHATAKLEGIDPGLVEWYHRLRNQLYHQGNGLTVERDKVEVYAELANALFRNLFGFDLVVHSDPEADLLSKFMKAWIAVEHGMSAMAQEHSLLGEAPRSTLDAARRMREAGFLSPAQVAEIDSLRRIRNEVFHGRSDYRSVITPAIVARVEELATIFQDDD